MPPAISVDQAGPLNFPLKPKVVEALVSQCEQAPFGKGTETLVDTKVRKTFELSPDRFQISDEWNAQVAAVVAQVSDKLGLPPGELRAELYKLLVYRRGGFFKPHRDSEKHDGMVASLIIVLPNPFAGGELTVRQTQSRVQKFQFPEAASGLGISYAAFYADCEHEVSRLSSGVRVCLCYNLILRTTAPASPKPRSTVTDIAPLLAAVRAWFTAAPATPLVLALEHQYSERSLSGELLKGNDRALADLVLPTAAAADCEIHLAHISRHLLQEAYNESKSRRDEDDWGWSPKPLNKQKLRIGATHEDELLGTQLTTFDGVKKPWQSISLQVNAIISQIPLEEWKPTSEEYEGYTGNTGNMLDRWYHRTAFVLWPKARQHTVLAEAGFETSVPALNELVDALATSRDAGRESVRADSIALALAIIADWPDPHDFFRKQPKEDALESLLTSFCSSLIKLNDRAVITTLLSQVAPQDTNLPLTPLLLHACRKFGLPAIAAELQAILTPPADGRLLAPFPTRNLEWLEAVCELPQSDPDTEKIKGDLCRQAASWYCADIARRKQDPETARKRAQNLHEKQLPVLLQVLLHCGCDTEVHKVVSCVKSRTDLFRLQHAHVPALKRLVPWSAQRFGEIPPLLRQWLTDVRQRLIGVTATMPQPPANWTRPATVRCSCQHCLQLVEFMKDPTAEVHRIFGSDKLQSHLAYEISRCRLDLVYDLESQQGRYALVMQKTQASFDRILRRYQRNIKLLEDLPQPAGDT